jgi:type 1 glutamine amidotransferase
MKGRFSIIGTTLVLSLAVTQIGSSGAPEHATKDTPVVKKICFVAGTESHGSAAHAHSAGCRYLAEVLNKNMPGIRAVVHKGGWPKDRSFLDGVDAIVMFCDGGGRHMVIPHLEEVDKLFREGVGIACLHYGVEVPKGKPGDYFLAWTGGYFETHWSVNPHWKAEFKSFPKHPVTSGVEPFTMDDEWYFHMRFRENMKGVTPVLSAHPPASTMKRGDGPHSGNPAVREALKNGRIQHLGWVSDSPEGGRGFGFTGGHWHKNWQDNNLRKLVLNAIVWIAEGQIPADGVPSETPTDEELNAYLK